MQCEEGGQDAPPADAVEVKALDAKAAGAAEVLAQVASLEKGIFPKHESMSGELEREVGKRNTTMVRPGPVRASAVGLRARTSLPLP